MEGDVLERSDGGMEQFLSEKRVSTGGQVKRQKTRTDLNLGFIYVHRQVGNDDLLRGLGWCGSGFTGSRCGSGISGTS